jgi:cation transport ATPase
VIGVVSFARSGELVGKRVIAALKAQKPRAQILHVSQARLAEARSLARRLGIDEVRGNLRQAAKVELIRGLGARVLWIGDGAEPELREAIAASTVSISVAGVSHIRHDIADVLLPQRGITGLPDVIALGQAHAQRLAQDYRTVYASNLLALGGTLVPFFGSLQAGLLSHLGAAVVYSRRARELGRLAATADAKQTRRLRLTEG